MPVRPRIAIVYDYMTQLGGCERLLRELHRIFPEAPIYTLVYDRKRLPDAFQEMDVRVSFIDRLPLSHRKFEWYIPLFGYAMEQFDFRDFDLVLSLSTMVAKGVVTPSHCHHVSWCFSPMRWAWDLYPVYLEELRKRHVLRKAFRLCCHYYRLWDVCSAPRVNQFLAGSQAARDRIRKHYSREAGVLHPPIDTDFFCPDAGERGDYYLVVSRLVLAKRIDLVLDTFATLDRPLVVIGTGEREASLHKRAGKNVTFLGFQPDEVVREHYRRCKALLFPGEEDFGLTPVEAQACGCPVIAYAAGGALETIRDGTHGVLFDRQTPAAIAEAIGRFEVSAFDSAALRTNALRFSRNAFRHALFTHLGLESA